MYFSSCFFNLENKVWQLIDFCLSQSTSMLACWRSIAQVFSKAIVKIYRFLYLKQYFFIQLYQVLHSYHFRRYKWEKVALILLSGIFFFFYYHILSVYLIIGCVFVNSFVVEFWRSKKDSNNNTSILKLLLNWKFFFKQNNISVESFHSVVVQITSHMDI